MNQYKLNNETIDLLSGQLEAMYQRNGCSKKETTRARLLLEEALIKYQTRFGEDVELTYREYTVLRQTRFVIRIRSASFDPFTLEENPMAFMIQTMMSSFEGAVPTWKYRNMENELVFTLHKKSGHSNVFSIGVAAALSLLLGTLARFLLPEDLRLSLVNDYLDPLSNAYASLFCVMAVLLTFFAIALSIVHIGDVNAVGTLGKKILKRFYLVTSLSAIVLILPLLPFFPIGIGQGGLSLAAKSIYDILIGFIPSNLVAPFLNFNSIHIMLIGVMFGFSLLAMGQKGDTLVEIFDECNVVAVMTNNFLNRFIFVYMALKIFAIITTSNFTILRGAFKMVAIILLGQAILFIVAAIRGSRKTGLPFREYAKIALPPFMICLSSGNFGAAFSSMFDTCFAFKGESSTVNLGINLGSVVFQPATTFMVICSSLFMANQFGVEITPVWIVMAILLSTVLVSSVPNIPGAAISVYTLLFAQLGIPAEALAFMITVNALLQFPGVAVDAWCMVAEITSISQLQE